MELKKVRLNTYAISYPSAVGVYVFDDQSCVLIDSGASASFGKKTLNLSANQGYKVRGIINTHSHADHCGGNHYIQEATNCAIYASATEAPFLGNPMLEMTYLYSASPIKSLKNKFVLAPRCTVTNIIGPGKAVINGAEFRFIDLSGHSLGQIGVETPDGVLFAGDSLIVTKILSNHPFLYLVDVSNHINSLNTLLSWPGDCIYLSHGGLVNNLGKEIRENRHTLDQILNLVLDIVKSPKGREEILRELAQKLRITLNQNGYYRSLSSISAFLSFLCNEGKIQVGLQDGLMKFERVR